jgi:23S rRNA (guanosine2251-2'-O)-methyltransferase
MLIRLDQLIEQLRIMLLESARNRSVLTLNLSSRLCRQCDRGSHVLYGRLLLAKSLGKPYLYSTFSRPPRRKIQQKSLPPPVTPPATTAFSGISRQLPNRPKYTETMDVLYGLHPVEEALRSGARPLDHISVARERESRRDPRMDAVLDLARAKGVRISPEPRDQLTRHCKTDAHQGIVAFVRERKFLALEDLLNAPAGPSGKRFFLALDGVEDPHNLGALLRSADGAGIDGVILPERRSAPLSAVTAKSSAGASEHVRIAQVVNITRALEALKKQNIWIVGLDERGTPDYTGFDFQQDVCLVLGSEGSGLHDLVKRTCDHLLRIPMAGSVSSLNVSVAGAVVMYEAMRQRRTGPSTQPKPQESKPPKPRKGLGS